MASRIEELLSEALGRKVDLSSPPKRLTKRQRLERQLARLEERQRERISRGRTRGAGAGGYNRDIENIVHQIRLIRSELDCLID